MSGYRKRVHSKASQSLHLNGDATLNINSEKWLAVYGLKKLKLDFKQILSSVGFRNCDDYISVLKKPVSSRYSEGLFKKAGHKDGKYYNIVASKDGLSNFESRLAQVVDLYKRRLEWLTSGSRRSFGIIDENQICIVCDVQQAAQEDFQFYQQIVSSVIKEQLPSVGKFNLIRVTSDISKWQPLCITANDDSVKDALSWWLGQPESTEYSLTSGIETVLDAACDNQVEAIYLFTDGSLLKGAKEIFLEKIKTISVPLHIVFARDVTVPSDADQFFNDVIDTTKGKYHSFTFKSTKSEQQQSLTNQKGHGVRPDVMKVWEQLDKARNTLFDIKSLITDIEAGKLQAAAANVPPSLSPPPPQTRKSNKANEVYMDSNQWLQANGLKKLKLTLHAFLKQSVFNHCDGVIESSNNSNTNSVMVNAQYCKKFVHMTWPDGSVKHVQVTEPVYRSFREQMSLVLDKYKRRLEWLQKGSRELFGTIVENKIILLIDTSSSMESKLHIVKKKLLQLLKEQLGTKESFNVISFNSKVSMWRETLVPCDLENLQNVLHWINDLEAKGSTNTFGAMTAAYEMDGVQALYLLSDGRPDQPVDLIISQVREAIPVHTISFNCADPEANEFLYNLAAKTNGRYHYFYDEHRQKDGLPIPYESEDLMLIRQEIEMGVKDLESMLQLRNECLNKDLMTKEERGYMIKSRDDLEMLQSNTLRETRKRPSTAVATYHHNKASLLRNGLLLAQNKPDVPHNRKKASSSDVEKVEKSKKKESTIKKWLRRNGLTALKLNILDALAPTIVRQKPTYVPTLGKEVLSKVYGQVLPIVHTSGGKEFQMVNPQAVDLVSYEERLKTALDNIERKLDTFVFEHLSEDFKETLADEQQFSYFRMKDDVDNDFENQNGSSSTCKDVRRLVVEIDQGNIFLNQSKDLREVIQQLANEAREEREALRESSPSIKKPSRPDTEKSKSPKFRYHRVLARYDEDGFYYPAIVNKYVNARYVNVLFDDGENQLTCVRYLIPIGGSAPCPTLNVGDYVLVKSYKRNEDIELTSIFYVPGIIQVTPLKMKAMTKCYTVIKFNGSKYTALRKDVVKITRSRFTFAVKFIQELQMPESDRRQFQSLPNAERKVCRTSDVSSQVSTSSRESGHVVSSRGLNRSSTRDGAATSDSEEKSDNDSQRHQEENSDDDQRINDVESEGESENGKDSKEISRNDTLPSPLHADEAEERKRCDRIVDELQVRLEEQHSAKMNELEKQKTLLMELHEKLSLNESKQTTRYEQLEKERAKLYKEQQKFLEKQLKVANSEKRDEKNHFKNLSEMQIDIFTRQQEQQEKLIERLLEKEKELLHHKDSLKDIMMSNTEEKQSSQSSPGDITDDDMIPDVKVEPDPSSELDTEKPEDDRFRITVSPRLDAMLMTKGDSGLFVSRNPLENDPSVGMRKVLSVIKVNDEVLARFKDDGWYYRGIVKDVANNSSIFIVEDGGGDVEEFERHDIISDEDDANNIIQLYDHVIALHPCYLHSYAPGAVLATEDDAGLKIQFYDGQVHSIQRSEAYLISPEKFDSDSNFIRTREYLLIGQAVISRSDKSGVYHLGMVRDRVAGCRNFLIEWADQSLEIQNYAFIFGAHTKRQQFKKGSHILAVSNQDTFCYLPGTVIECDGSLLHVEFCDSNRLKNVDANQSFWLSEDYFKMALQYWKSHHE